MAIHLILTHEQADFDAVAALLAARLLEPQAHAVLPRRLNRNVRAFLNLYGDDLPLEDAAALPKEAVARVTLVDVQTFPSTRGVTAQSRVHVVDHHPLHRPLPQGWTANIEPLGATTTLLGESLRDRNGGLTVAGATLLLLGIYEDTGSLSYAGTSPRDVQMAAWLLEQGASLAVAADFLHHPLSPQQQALYERLLEAAEPREIQGQRVVISHAQAPAEVEEISTLAHKLRDLFDPEGLILVVDLGSHVQLVARSSTDQIDVGEVAAHFGGGGHSRAAAAVVRGRTVEAILEELEAILPQHVLPALRVESIYSPAPQVLSPATEVLEAGERMQRYGYEGFPVVEQGQVVGLLTRRAVDRALAHGMKHASVGSVMESGSVVVQPGDSILHLQRLMVEHGWGQVPVVSAEAGEVIGIVTRTDLLKALAPRKPASHLNLGGRLGEAFPVPQLALLRVLARMADEKHVGLYLVGGVVRDLLLGISSPDLDLVVEGDAIALARAVAERHGGRVRGHDRFGTAKWLLAGSKETVATALGLAAEEARQLPESLDLVSARAEFYPRPTALPEVERGSLKLDLHRRDFTINTLAICLNAARFGELFDYWGGLRDLQEKRIRVLHSISFVDDPTRILRAARLEQRLGFTLETRTQELLTQALALLHRVSGDRLRHELEAMLEEPEPQKALGRLEELGVLAQIEPGLCWPPQGGTSFAEVRQGQAVDLEGLEPPPLRLCYLACWLLALPGPVMERVLLRLNVPHREAEWVLEARRSVEALAALPGEARPSAIVAVLSERAPAACLLARATLPPGQQRAWVDRYLAEWRHVRPIATGLTLRARGVLPGPAYRDILWKLRAAWLDGWVRSQEEEAALLDQLLTVDHAPS